MSHYIKIVLFTVLSVIVSKSYCQEPAETETIKKHFILYKVTNQKGDTAMGLVYAKENYGLVPGG
jgi:hypothetical protein